MDFVRILWVLAVVTALALCVVWQGSETRRAGRRLEELTWDIEALKAEQQKGQERIDRLKSPQRIVPHALKLGLRPTETPSGPMPEFVPLRMQSPPAGTAGRGTLTRGPNE
ncbi:MAG: hypothetical protein QGH74_06745 [Candidatus Brocadiia bacterium]|jgi:hypothetical protein|nr:hypothetical protein [Candidatus Brocadiia bacterium]